MTAPPEFRRELIRHANRRGYNGTEVTALLECAEWAYEVTERDGLYEVPTSDEAVIALIELWEESFDAEP